MSSTSVVKQRIHQAIAEAVLSEIQSKQARWYYFLGKTLDFQGGEVETPSASLSYEAQTRNDMIAIKAINAGDVSFVIPRIEWTSGTVYDMYDDAEDENVSNFYAMDSDTFNVYKCLDNNYGSPSTSKPTNTDVEPFTTPDGYKWKFMFNVPLASRTKFLTDAYIPVSNSLRNRFFSNGGIESVSIENAGSGYTQNTTTIVVDGDGQGAILRPVVQGGKLVDVIIENPGFGYSFTNIEVESTRASAVNAQVITNLSRGDINSPQALTETLATPGTIDTILVTAGGSGYTTAPTVSIIGDGTGCTATTVITGGVVTRINVTNPGSGYTFAEVILTGEASAPATARAIISPPGGHGRNAVTELRARTLMFYGNLSNERLAGFTVDNDYRQFGILRNPKTREFTSRIVDTSSFRHFNVVGTVPIQISQFPVGTSVFDGDNDEYTVVSAQTSRDGSTGLVLFSPINKEVQVGTTFQRLSPSFSFTVVNVTSQVDAVAQIATAAYVVTPVSFNSTLFPQDTILENGTKRFVVVANDSEKLLVLPKNGGTLQVGMELNIQGTGISFVIKELVQPAFDRNSGDLLFIDNRLPFSQTEDQTVTFRTVIQY